MNNFLSTFASTNARIALSLCLWLLTVLSALVGLMLGLIDAKALQVLDHIGVGLLLAMGVDVVQFIGKRMTFDAEAHATPLRSDTTPARDDVLAPAAIAPAATTSAVPVDESRSEPPQAAPMARPSHIG